MLNYQTLDHRGATATEETDWAQRLPAGNPFSRTRPNESKKTPAQNQELHRRTSGGERHKSHGKSGRVCRGEKRRGKHRQRKESERKTEQSAENRRGEPEGLKPTAWAWKHTEWNTNSGSWNR